MFEFFLWFRLCVKLYEHDSERDEVENYSNIEASCDFVNYSSDFVEASSF